MPEQELPTRGQLERSLSQNIQGLYRQQLGHQPSRVTCNLIGEQLTVIIEDAITQPELFLMEKGKEELTEEVRLNLEDFLKGSLKTLVKDIIGVEVIDLLSDTTLETGRSAVIAVLASKPKLRRKSSDSEIS
ncbi:MAG: DUF2294 domain-containing protein [Spirulinaceae cyanobacterium]